LIHLVHESIHSIKRQVWKEEHDMKIDVCQDSIETIQTAQMKVLNRFKFCLNRF